MKVHVDTEIGRSKCRYIFIVANLSCYGYRCYLVKICLGILEWWLRQIKAMKMTPSEARNEPLSGITRDERNFVCRDQVEGSKLAVKLV